MAQWLNIKYNSVNM